MRRGLWFAAGAGAGVYAMNRARRLRESLTTQGLRDRAQAVALGLRLAREEVEQGRIDKEVELRERLGLAPMPADRQLAPPGRPSQPSDRALGRSADHAALGAAQPDPIRTTRQRGSH